jgi:cystathionine beta-lyase
LDFRRSGIPEDRLGSFIRDTAGIALLPGTMFGCKIDGFERINIACPRVLLKQALGKISQAVKNSGKINGLI